MIGALRRTTFCLAGLTLALTACTATEAEPESRPEASPSPTADPDLLLPDMTTLPASSVSLETSGGGTRMLRFGTTLANVGDGPMEVIPDADAPCPDNERYFAQEVTRDGDGDGRYAPDADDETVRQEGACGLFHADHGHWDIDGSARYELLDPTGETVIKQDKVSFCLRDTDRVPGGDAPTGETYGECSNDALQGISPGWGDLYDADLNGQVLILPGDLTDGTYCLKMSADPFDYFVESDENNNASVTSIEIDGDDAEQTESAQCASMTRSPAPE